MTNIDKEIDQFLRRKLSGLLQLCTSSQAERFNRNIYPGGVPSSHLKDAIALCERTIQSNSKTRTSE